MASMTTVKCACCKKEFQARTADVARGWGKFCSKRCKAIKQEARTGQHRSYMERGGGMSDADRMHEQALYDAFPSHGQDGF